MYEPLIGWLGRHLPKGLGVGFPDEHEHGWHFKIGRPHRWLFFLGLTEDIAIVRREGKKTLIEVKPGWWEMIRQLTIAYSRQCPSVKIEMRAIP